VLGSLGRSQRRATFDAPLLAGGFRGVFSVECEAGPVNGVEGSKYLYREVLAAPDGACAGGLNPRGVPILT